VVVTELQNFGYAHLTPIAGSQLLLLENIYAPILGFILYQEHILSIEFLGAFIVLVGVYAYNQYAKD
jgi:drug/metabolite transporter (DMT)-like permease